MKHIKLITLIFVFLSFGSLSQSEELYFVNMQKILNKSKAGSSAQETLKKEFSAKDKKYKASPHLLKKKKQNLLLKKSLSPDEYKKKVSALRKKNVDFQSRRRQASSDFVKKKNDARDKLIKAINPILQKYMSENNIMMIINEKNVILANSQRDLTQNIIDLLDKELKSIKLN